MKLFVRQSSDFVSWLSVIYVTLTTLIILDLTNIGLL